GIGCNTNSDCPGSPAGWGTCNTYTTTCNTNSDCNATPGWGTCTSCPPPGTGSCCSVTHKYCALGDGINATGHSMMANGPLEPKFSTTYDHLYNGRFLMQGSNNVMPTANGSPSEYFGQVTVPGYSMIGPPPYPSPSTFWNRNCGIAHDQK